MIAPFIMLLIGQLSPVLSEDACYQTNSPLVILRKDPLSGTYEVFHRMAVGESLSFPGVQARMLQLDSSTKNAHTPGFLRRVIGGNPGELAKGGSHEQAYRGLQARNYGNVSLDYDSDDELYYAWECGCHDISIPVVYCPLSIDTCLPTDSWKDNALPGCLNVPNDYTFHQYSVFVMGFCIAAIFAALVSTSIGTSLFGFLVSQCFPRWNDMAVNRLVRDHPERVRDMIRIHIIREQRALFEARRQEGIAQGVGQSEGDGPRDWERGVPNPEGERRRTDEDKSRYPPTRLVLSIKKYKRPSPTITEASETNEVDSSSDVEEDQCTICFHSLEDGDRVGSLKCNHLFHSECLKLWLQRRNACPLCQTREIAAIRNEDNLTDTEASANQDDIQVEPAQFDAESNN